MIGATPWFGDAIFSETGQPQVDQNDLNVSLVQCYSDLLKLKRIWVWVKAEGGLFARIDHLTTRGEVFKIDNHLPLQGAPKVLAKEIDPRKLFSFFRLTHLVTEKGLDGIDNRVTVHISGKGGMRPIIPFQPGIALGSIVKGDMIEKMQAYAEDEAAIEALEEQFRNVENQLDLVDKKIELRRAQLRKRGLVDESQQDNKCGLLKAWKAEKDALYHFLDVISEQISDLEDSLKPDNNPNFTPKFQQGIVSPLDFKACVIKNLPRGFDSMNYNSTYILKSEGEEGLVDKLSHSSSASSWSTTVTPGSSGIKFFKGASANLAHFAAVAKRTSDIFKKNTTEGVLIINAFVTTRNVRTITEIKYDLSKLEEIRSVMQSSKSDDLERYGITIGDRHGKSIYILTEAVLGGSFTALVTFHEGSNEGISRTVDSSNTGLSGGFALDALTPGGVTIGGGISGAKENKEIDEKKQLDSVRETKIDIEFISQGALPTFARDVVQQEILKHLNLNPSSYAISAKDSLEAEKLVQQTQEGDLARARYQMKMQNAQVAIMNAFDGLKEDQEQQKEQQNVHTMDSVMQAYESFASKITEDQECGVPVGFYYDILTQSDIEDLIQKLTKEKGNTPVGGTSIAQ